MSEIKIIQGSQACSPSSTISANDFAFCHSGTRKTVMIVERYHPAAASGSSHHASSVNEQKITSSKAFERPNDSLKYLVKTSKCEFSMFSKTADVIERPKFTSLFGTKNMEFRLVNSLNQQVFEQRSVFKTPDFFLEVAFSSFNSLFSLMIFCVFVLHCSRRSTRSGNFPLLGNPVNIFNQSQMYVIFHIFFKTFKTKKMQEATTKDDYSAFNFSFHELCLIFKDRFFIRFSPSFHKRLLMSSASPHFVFSGPKNDLF